MRRVCAVDGCGRRVVRWSICQTHSRRLEMWGSVCLDVPVGGLHTPHRAGGRIHDPQSCDVCIEVPHLAALGCSPEDVATRLSTSVANLEQHIRRHPELSRWSRWVLPAASRARNDRVRTRAAAS